MLLIYGFRLFDIVMDIVLTRKFCHNIMIWKMTIFDIDIKLKLNQHYHALGYFTPLYLREGSFLEKKSFIKFSLS